MKLIFVFLATISTLFSASVLASSLMSTTSKGGDAVNCQNYGLVTVCQYTPKVSIRTDLIQDRIENNTIYYSEDKIAVTITYDDIDGTVTNASYFIDGQPLNVNQTIVTRWSTEIKAIVTDNTGLTTELTRFVSPPNIAICKPVGLPFISVCGNAF